MFIFAHKFICPHVRLTETHNLTGHLDRKRYTRQAEKAPGDLEKITHTHTHTCTSCSSSRAQLLDKNCSAVLVGCCLECPDCPLLFIHSIHRFEG